jgi:hypothetical protein
MTFETKYDPGDMVWFISSNTLREGTISHVKSILETGSSAPSTYVIVYKLKDGNELKESLLFESKAHLISHLAGTEL